MKKKLCGLIPLSAIAIITFVSIFIFYYIVHPLYIYDVDDWAYVTGVRHALPSLSQWNPTKILPETLMPLVSSMAAWLIFPLTGDYIQSLCMAFAFVTAGFITLYIVMTARVIEQKNHLRKCTLLFVMQAFILIHFFVYLTSDEANRHFFYTGNVTCLFNYLIPALWNFILCLYFMTAEKVIWQDKNSVIKKGCIVLAVYLAIHSNLWHSIILMAYIGIELLSDFLLGGGICIWKKRSNHTSSTYLRDYMIRNVPGFTALLVWFLSMIFEINGGRANWNASETLQIRAAIKEFGRSLTQIRKEFLITAAAVNLAAVCIAIYRRKKLCDKEEAGRFLLEQGKKLAVMVLSIIYLILLASKVSPQYLKNPSVMISWMLWLMLVSILSTTYLIRLEPRISWLLPLMVYILLFEVLVDKKTFAENYVASCPPSVVKMIDDDIIRQVKEAERNGDDSVNVYIPVKGSGGWPIDPGMIAYRISNALYYHGVTDRHMTVGIVPDENKDMEFHIK